MKDDATDPKHGESRSDVIATVEALDEQARREQAVKTLALRWSRVRVLLKARLGDEVFTNWFTTLELDAELDGLLHVSVPVKFLQNWIQTHYSAELLECCRAEFSDIGKVVVALRQHGHAARKAKEGAGHPANSSQHVATVDAKTSGFAGGVGGRRPTDGFAVPAANGRTQVDGFEGSPLDPRYTFESFVVGNSNRIAHAGAVQVAETVLSPNRAYNPLYIHSSVGLGKTHLLQAVAWRVKELMPSARLLYLTAERFRYQFVEALKYQDASSFKEKFRNIDLLLIDDLEFMQGERTEQEFDHIINALLDGGKQIVVASARAPAQLERLSDRMRSRLQRGLVTELAAPDYDLRLEILQHRASEKAAVDRSFVLPLEVLELLAQRLVENGRELEGAVTRLHATWQYTRTPITLDISETIIRDLVQGLEPRRIKIEDILRVVSRHYGVSKNDILSERRHRSVVWPRQIGMYLAKQMTSRSLPEIGRRFGNRDHTTVLHAIRKIDGVLKDNTRLRDELEDLKRMLNTI